MGIALRGVGAASAAQRTIGGDRRIEDEEGLDLMLQW